MKANHLEKRSNNLAKEMRILAAKESRGSCDCVIILPHLLTCLVEKATNRFDTAKLVASYGNLGVGIPNVASTGERPPELGCGFADPLLDAANRRRGYFVPQCALAKFSY